jgi:hypothetical protein
MLDQKMTFRRRRFPMSASALLPNGPAVNQQHGLAGLNDRSHASIPSVLKLGKRKLKKIKEAALLQPLSSVLVDFLQCSLTDRT